MLIIGSHAMAQYSPMSRVLKDLDVIGWPDELEEFLELCTLNREKDGNKYVLQRGDLMIEFEVATKGSNQEALLNILGNRSGRQEYASLDVLYALKMSHRHRKNSPHFLKTMRDIHLMRSLRGGDKSIPSYLHQWYDWRVKDTYNYAHPKLNQGKKDFFTPDAFPEGKSPYVYDHDSIHEAVCIYDRPAYEHFSDGPVKVSREQFEACPEEIKLASVYEESAVLALERSVIPFNTDPYKAFHIALEKCCTSIASGWWRDYAWENYFKVKEVLLLQNPTFVEKFEKGLAEGIIKPFSGGAYE